MSAFEEELPHDPERDPQILEITNSLCQQLGVTNYHPTFVSWEVYAIQGRNPRTRRVFPPDECLLEKYSVTLSGWMRGKLEPDEWRPIIASSLIFSKKLRRRTFTGFLIPAVILIALAALIMTQLPVLLPQPVTFPTSGNQYYPPEGQVIAYPAGLILGFMVPILIGTVLARRTRLLADEEAAFLVGASVFLSTLKKISGLTSPGQQWKRGGTSRPLPLLPSLPKRIDMLEKYASLGER